MRYARYADPYTYAIQEGLCTHTKHTHIHTHTHSHAHALACRNPAYAFERLKVNPETPKGPPKPKRLIFNVVTAIQDMEVKLRAMRNMLEEGDRWVWGRTLHPARGKMWL